MWLLKCSEWLVGHCYELAYSLWLPPCCFVDSTLFKIKVLQSNAIEKKNIPQRTIQRFFKEPSLSYHFII